MRRVTSTTDALNHATSFTYDANSNKLTTTKANSEDYTFDASGNITNRALDNGTSTAYTVDQVNRDTAVVHSLVGTTRRFDYAYNSVNDILAVQRDSGLGDGFTYDLNQEILGFAQNGTVNLGAGAVTNPQTNTNLTFDGCGNQTSLNGGGTFAVDYLNEYTTFSGAPVSSDNDGDVLTYNGWTYTYDAQNRLISAALNNVTIATFNYDGLNRQITRSINGAVTFSVWDGDWAILEEYGLNNTVSQKYLQGYHGLVKTLVDNIYYYQDELGSTSHVANASGTLLEYYKYNLYGAPTYWNAGGTQISVTGYNVRDLGDGGARWISELALYDDRNRFMSPALGRFIQPDPIGFKGDASNLYRYCGNDWANKTDPMGLVQEPFVPQTYVDPAQAIARMQGIINQKLSLGYGAAALAGLYHSLSKLQQQQSENASSVSVTGQATNSQGTQAKQSSSTALPNSFRVLEGQTKLAGMSKDYEYQAYVNGKPLHNGAGVEIKEEFTTMYSKHVDFKQTTGFRPLDKNGRWGDNVGFHFGQRQPPKWAMDIREQRFYARRIGDKGAGTLMDSHFIHMSFLSQGRVNNQVFDVSHVDEH